MSDQIKWDDGKIWTMIEAGDVAGLRRHWAEKVMKCLTELFASLGRLDAVIRESEFEIGKPMAADIAAASHVIAEVDVLIAESEDVSYNAFVRVVSHNFKVMFENIAILTRLARDAGKPSVVKATEEVCRNVSDVANADCFRSWLNGCIESIRCGDESGSDRPTVA